MHICTLCCTFLFSVSCNWDPRSTPLQEAIRRFDIESKTSTEMGSSVTMPYTFHTLWRGCHGMAVFSCTWGKGTQAIQRSWPNAHYTLFFLHIFVFLLSQERMWPTLTTLKLSIVPLSNLLILHCHLSQDFPRLTNEHLVIFLQFLLYESYSVRRSTSISSLYCSQSISTMTEYLKIWSRCNSCEWC